MRHLVWPDADPAELEGELTELLSSGDGFERRGSNPGEIGLQESRATSPSSH